MNLIEFLIISIFLFHVKVCVRFSIFFPKIYICKTRFILFVNGTLSLSDLTLLSKISYYETFPINALLKGLIVFFLSLKKLSFYFLSYFF